MGTDRTQMLVVNGFRALLETDGAGRFLRSPLFEPDTRSFPDAWTPDQDGVHRLLRRIMFVAGLGDVPLTIERFVFNDDAEGGAAHGRHVIAFFRGVNAGCCEFGVNCAQLDDPEHLIASSHTRSRTRSVRFIASSWTTTTTKRS
jgi:hypothetical protein